MKPMTWKYSIPVLSITLAVLTGCDQSDSSFASNTVSADAKKAQIEKDCGTSEEETKAWFASHKTGWAEHVEAGLKCIREHQ
jgi:pyrroloquinoline quinone (PQQ) biosynthesis protein C